MKDTLITDEIEAIQKRVSSLQETIAKVNEELIQINLILGDASTRMLVGSNEDVSVNSILKIVCMACYIEIDQMLLVDRFAAVVKARHLAAWALKKHTNMSLTLIGTKIRKEPYNHASVLHGIKKVNQQRDLVFSGKNKTNEIYELSTHIDQFIMRHGRR